MKRDYIIGVGVIVVLAALIIGGSAIRKVFLRGQEAERIADISNSKAPQTIADLKRTIAAYERQLDQFIKASNKTATYWKILATRLQDRGDHNEALKALQNAVQHAPEDPALFYMTGISAGILGKAGLGFPGAENSRYTYYELAEEAYLRAIELKEAYDKPIYALAILYVFEMDKAEAAVPLLQRYIASMSIKNSEGKLRNPDGATDGMFVLARAYYMLGRNAEAAEQYELIMDTCSKSKNEHLKDKYTQAALLRQQVY